MPNSTSADRIRRQLRSLLAKSQDSGCTAAEAASALALAEDLMRKHHVDRASLVEKEEQALSFQRVAVSVNSARLAPWHKQLASAVETVVGSVGCYFMQGENQVTFYGDKGDIDLAADVFRYWSGVVEAEARLQYGGAFRGTGRAYAIGFAAALLGQARNSRSKAQEAAEELGHLTPSELEKASNSDGSSSLVLAASLQLAGQRRDWAQQELEAEGIRLTNARRTQVMADKAAFTKGKTDGARANIDRSAPRATLR